MFSTRRKGIVAAAGVLALVVVLAAAFVFVIRDDSSNDAQGAGGNLPPPPSGPIADDASTLTILAPTDLGSVIGALSDEFRAVNPDVTIQLVTGESRDLFDRVQSGEQASIYIDSAPLIARLDANRYVGQPAPFGYDLFSILVARGNPKGVQGLGVFGADPSTISGMCIIETPCGLQSAGILERAGVVGTPDHLLPSGSELTDQVASGVIDAALVLRSAGVARFRGVSSVAIPEEINFRVDYEIAQLREAPVAAEFFEFVQSDQNACRAKRANGLVSLLECGPASP